MACSAQLLVSLLPHLQNGHSVTQSLGTISMTCLWSMVSSRRKLTPRGKQPTESRRVSTHKQHVAVLGEVDQGMQLQPPDEHYNECQLPRGKLRGGPRTNLPRSPARPIRHNWLCSGMQDKLLCKSRRSSRCACFARGLLRRKSKASRRRFAKLL